MEEKKVNNHSEMLIQKKHLAATSPNPNTRILRALLERGASVHLRNHRGSNEMYDHTENTGNKVGHSHTPLFLAARNGLAEHVRLLREAGAHLYPGEMAEATAEAKIAANQGSVDGDVGQKCRKSIWNEAGLEL